MHFQIWETYISPPPTAINSDNLLDPYEDPNESPRDMLKFDDHLDETTGQLLHQQPAEYWATMIKIT